MKRHGLFNRYGIFVSIDTEVSTPERCKKCSEKMKYVVENDGILRRAFYHCSNCDEWTALWQVEVTRS